MLSGWTLLAATCPSSDCFGTPLMSTKGNFLFRSLLDALSSSTIFTTSCFVLLFSDTFITLFLSAHFSLFSPLFPPPKSLVSLYDSYIDLYNLFSYISGQATVCVSCDKKYQISNYDGNYEEITKNVSFNSVPKITERKNENNINVINIGYNSNKSDNNKENGNSKEKSLITDNRSNKENSVASINNNDSDYLPPLFDLSDAPILDFSTEDSVEDPSSLISKVSQIF